MQGDQLPGGGHARPGAPDPGAEGCSQHHQVRAEVGLLGWGPVLGLRTAGQRQGGEEGQSQAAGLPQAGVLGGSRGSQALEWAIHV